MKDMREHLEKLRVQAVQCETIRDLAIDPKKRELFDRLADHHKTMAAEIERTRPPSDRSAPLSPEHPDEAAVQSLVWAIEEIAKIGNKEAERYARAALKHLHGRMPGERPTSRRSH